MKKLLPITILSLLLDQVIKVIVINSMGLFESIDIIHNFFKITYVRNNGAAFSIMSGNRLFLIFVTIIALVVIYSYFIKDKKLNKLENISYGLLIGGILGNLIDRIIYGYVIDYLDFKIFSYSFPVFNIADTCIVISIILISISLIGGEFNARNKNK